MKIIRPYVQIETNINGQGVLKKIETIARTCYKSESKITENSAEKMVA